MLTPKVSVVVPIYNVESFIERCVRSLFEQTLQEIEYIFVNDCTPDASMEVLTRVLACYPERQSWVRIITMPQNSGQAKVRAAGIKSATGEYIIHCDSDDWVEPEMYQVMYEKAVAETLDMVICGFTRRYADGRKEETIYHNMEDKDLIQELLYLPMGGSLCTKMISRSLYQSETIEYARADMLEDMVYTIQLVLSSQRIGFIDCSYCNYFVNTESISYNSTVEGFLRRSQGWATNLSIICSVLQKYKLYNRYKKELMQMKLKAREFMWPLVLKEPSKYIPIWASTFPELNWQYPLNQSAPFTLRLIFLFTLLRIYPYWYRCFRA